MWYVIDRYTEEVFTKFNDKDSALWYILMHTKKNTDNLCMEYREEN